MTRQTRGQAHPSLLAIKTKGNTPIYLLIRVDNVTVTCAAGAGQATEGQFNDPLESLATLSWRHHVDRRGNGRGAGSRTGGSPPGSSGVSRVPPRSSSTGEP